jgi:carboxypeptidase PM20D1
MDYLEKFREALKIPTWWAQEAQAGDVAAEAPLLRFQDFLAENFPAFHKAAERWILNPYSVVYHLPCAAGNTGAVLFTSHYDVVPAEAEKWSADPFSAEIKDGYIYGRGSLDIKCLLIGIMEAAETLCAEGWKPKRDIWFAFGGDEERNGILGAMEIVKWFQQQGQRFDWVLDEGTPISVNQIKGVDSPVALLSIEEKGFLSLSLTAKQKPGHASQPPKVQAATVIARALCKIDKKPFPFRLSSTVEMFFKQLSVFMPRGQKFVMRHARAFGPLFFKLAATTPIITSMLRTTVAMTQFEGSAADNVMPSEVRAVINLRLLWPWTIETATAYIKKAINDKRVKVDIYGLGSDPVPASREYQRKGWTEFQAALAEAWPGVPLLPFLMIAATDSRHYQKICDCIFRFDPYKVDSKELNTIHGHDERISIENLRRILVFYSQLLRSL